VDDYDLHVAHFLVQGCDVLDEQPASRSRPAARADEGGDQRHAAHVHRRRLVGRGLLRQQRLADRRQADPNDHGAQDWADAQAIYALIEQQLVPTFYERDDRGLPRRWLQVVKHSIRTVLPHFSARRMVKDYVRDMYLPAVRRETLTR
jgi:starch phosphorylase